MSDQFESFSLPFEVIDRNKLTTFKRELADENAFIYGSKTNHYFIKPPLRACIDGVTYQVTQVNGVDVVSDKAVLARLRELHGGSGQASLFVHFTYTKSDEGEKND